MYNIVNFVHAFVFLLESWLREVKVSSVEPQRREYNYLTAVSLFILCGHSVQPHLCSLLLCSQRSTSNSHFLTLLNPTLSHLLFDLMVVVLHFYSSSSAKADLKRFKELKLDACMNDVWFPQCMWSPIFTGVRKVTNTNAHFSLFHQNTTPTSGSII